ncbi:hypothetical protein Cs7R123_20910 [Catellatospora sp. TT07R-123]|nr:hypothetical protein Cs7R123_20910 [Catellatospora sp. TT07R-123]
MNAQVLTPKTVLDVVGHWADTTSGSAARCGAALPPSAVGSAPAGGGSAPVTASPPHHTFVSQTAIRF